MQRIFQPAEKVVIDQLDHEIHLFEDDRPTRVLSLDGTVARAAADSSTAMGVPASWHGRQLVSIESLGGRGVLIETYDLSADGRTLTVRATMQGGPSGRPSPTFQRIYTKYDGN